MAARTPLLTGLSFPESPRWHDSRLWLADWGAHEVIAVDVNGRSEVTAKVESFPFSIDWLPDGRLLAVSARDCALLRQEPDGSLVPFVELSELSGHPWNEIVVDGRGNVYLNNTGFDFPGGTFAPGIIALVTPDGSVRQVADEVAFPNGMAVTPDNSTLILAESYGNTLTGFDIAPDGSLYNRRVWANLGDGAPDGICTDADGAVWYADVPHQLCAACTRGRRGLADGPARPRVLCLHAGRTGRPNAVHSGQPMGGERGDSRSQPGPRRPGGRRRSGRAEGRLALSEAAQSSRRS